MTTPQTPQHTTQHTISALRNAARPLTGGDRDYDALLDLVGDARFVLLGEATPFEIEDKVGMLDEVSDERVMELMKKFVRGGT